MNKIFFHLKKLIFFLLLHKNICEKLFLASYEGKSISNQPIPFPIDRDTQYFHALFQ